MMKAFMRNWVLAVACCALIGKAESDGADRSIERFRQTVRFAANAHHPPISNLDMLVELTRTKLSQYEIVKAAQYKYGLTDDEVKDCLKGILFSKSEQDKCLSKSFMVEVLIHEEFFDDELRKYLENGIRATDRNWYFVRIYLELTGYNVESGFFHNLLTDKSRYSAMCRSNVYEELLLAYRNAHGGRRFRIGRALRECVLIELANLEAERRSEEAASCKRIVCILDANLRWDVCWLFSSQRLSVLKRAFSVKTDQKVSAVDNYVRRNMAFMKYGGPVLLAICLLFGVRAIIRCLSARAFERVAEFLHAVKDNGSIISIIKNGFRNMVGMRSSGTSPGGIGRASLIVWLMLSVCFARMIVYAFNRVTFLDASGALGLRAFGCLKKGLYCCVVLFVLLVVVQFARRLKNTGYPMLSVVLLAIPVVGLIVLNWCLARQAGYGKTRRLDTWGRVITTVYICVVLFLIAKCFLSLWGPGVDL